MAVRQIRIMGDEILTKKCKPVKAMNDRTMELIEDMFETMYQANGCGLAAPQVGVLLSLIHIFNSAMGRSEEEYLMAIASSFMVSADNAHAVHPNHGDKSDPVNLSLIHI